MRLNVVLFEKFTARECFYVFIFHGIFVLVNCEHSSTRYNSVIFTWYERTAVGNSLHVRSNFWCLIMTSTKLMQYVCVTSFL